MLEIQSLPRRLPRRYAPRNDVKKMPVKGGRGQNDVRVAFFRQFVSVWRCDLCALSWRRGGYAFAELKQLHPLFVVSNANNSNNCVLFIVLLFVSKKRSAIKTISVEFIFSSSFFSRFDYLSHFSTLLVVFFAPVSMRFVLIYSYIHFNGGCFGFMNFFLRSLYTRLALFASHIHYMNPFFFL